MARYEKVFTLEPMLYAQGSPVIIEAGALQKDNTNSSIIVQLKLKNISVKTIKALTVRITPLDTIGNVLGDMVEHQYLDLSVNRDENFGSKDAIVLPNNTTRAIKVSVTNVVFSDNSNIIIDEQEWTSIPNQEELNLDDIETKYFYSLFNINDKKQLIEHNDLWLCSCGAINHSNEDKCHCCKNSYEELKNIDLIELHNESYYQHFCLDIGLTNDIEVLEKATKNLESIIDYKDVKEIFDENTKRIMYLKSKEIKKKKKTKKISLIVIGLVILSIIVGTSGSAIVKAVQYNRGNKLIASQQYNEAYTIFAKLDNYKDSKKYALDAKIKGSKIGDVFTFGVYNDEEIEWRILAKENGKALVITEKIIECKPYDDAGSNVTWSSCSLRDWLNDEFIQLSFDDFEKSLIQTSLVVTEDDEKYDTIGGEDTNDKLFLLSEKEANKYLSSAEERICQGTEKAIENGLSVDEENNDAKGPWWLRSPGKYQDDAMFVFSNGYVGEYELYIEVNGNPQRLICKGISSDIDTYGVRPAMWIEVE